MDKNLDKDAQEKKMEEIAEQDWPLLRELESTRFSLRNKKGGNRVRQSLQTIKKVTEQEDQMISEQNIEDEKLVDAFLSVKPSNDTIDVNVMLNKEVEPKVIKIEEKVQPTIEVVKNIVVKDEYLPEEVVQSIAQVNVVSSVAPVVNQPVSNVSTAAVATKTEAGAEKSEEISKLIARGMAKTYITKTDSILNPLRFIISNAKEIGVALIQFIMPALITWYLTTNVEMISKELSKEAVHVHVVYTLIFYFACLFLWISGQVLFGGIINIIKQAMANLAKVGKS